MCGLALDPDSALNASKRFYVDRGLKVAESFGRKYVEFDTPSSPVKLVLYGRWALAKDSGVPQRDGTGSHRMLIGSDAGPFTDPDGFAWDAAGKRASLVTRATGAADAIFAPGVAGSHWGSCWG